MCYSDHLCKHYQGLPTWEQLRWFFQYISIDTMKDHASRQNGVNLYEVSCYFELLKDDDFFIVCLSDKSCVESCTCCVQSIANCLEQNSRAHLNRGYLIPLCPKSLQNPKIHTPQNVICFFSFGQSSHQKDKNTMHCATSNSMSISSKIS